MKKILLSISLLLSAPMLNAILGNKYKTNLGQEVAQAKINNNINTGEELVDEIYDLLENHTDEKDQEWLYKKLEVLNKIDGLEVFEEKVVEEVVEEVITNEEKININTENTKKESPSFINFINNFFGADESSIIKNEPQFGPENNPKLKFTDNENLSESVINIVTTVKTEDEKLNNLRELQIQLEEKNKCLKSQLTENTEQLKLTAKKISTLIIAKEEAKKRAERKRQEKEAAISQQNIELENLQKQIKELEEKQKIDQKSLTALQLDNK